MSIEVFDGRDVDHGDEAYLNWVRTHQEGYVASTRQNIDPDYVPLHRPSCVRITDEARYVPGAYARAQYIKVCADTIEELREWVRYSGPQKVDHSGHLYLLTFFALSTPLGCPPINLGRGPIVKGLMRALLIVEPEVGRETRF